MKLWTSRNRQRHNYWHTVSIHDSHYTSLETKSIGSIHWNVPLKTVMVQRIKQVAMLMNPLTALKPQHGMVRISTSASTQKFGQICIKFQWRSRGPCLRYLSSICFILFNALSSTQGSLQHICFRLAPFLFTHSITRKKLLQYYRLQYLRLRNEWRGTYRTAMASSEWTNAQLDPK